MPGDSNEFSPFPTPLIDANDVKGIGFVLFDNIWGTNYPVWYPYDDVDKNMTYRFSIML